MRIAALSNLAKDAQHPASLPESNRSICGLIFPELSGADHWIWTAKFRIIDPALFIQESVRIDPSTMLRTKGLVEM